MRSKKNSRDDSKILEIDKKCDTGTSGSAALQCCCWIRSDFITKVEFQECPKFKILSEILFRLFYICLWFFILISCLWFSFEVHPVLVKWKSGALCSWTMSDQMAAQLNLWRHYVIMWFRHVIKCKQDPPRPRSMSSDFKMNFIGLLNRISEIQVFHFSMFEKFSFLKNRVIYLIRIFRKLLDSILSVREIALT